MSVNANSLALKAIHYYLRGYARRGVEAEMKEGDNWVCPYCAHAQVLGESRISRTLQRFHVKNWPVGIPSLGALAIVCANENCKQLTLAAYLCTGVAPGGQYKATEQLQEWSLLPASSAKPQPGFIPEPLRRDYQEACAIRDLSPKASATITRRLLQGMIRDFCCIADKRLIDEINELRRRVNDGKAPPGVQSDNVDAIDQVRKIGNIGAHMEEDINVIVDVDPHEAQELIGLVELLFEEWYVARDARTRRMKTIGAIAEEKKALKTSEKPGAPVVEE